MTETADNYREDNGMVVSRGLMILAMLVLMAGCSREAVFTGAGTTRLNEVQYTVKQLLFSWPSVPDVESYRLLENPDGVSGYTPITGALPATTTSYDHNIAVHLQDWSNASYLLQSCIGMECTTSTARTAPNSVAAIGYLKASNTGIDDSFGHAVAVSGDGNTVAVGAPAEDSEPALGESNDNFPDSGAVYLFTRVEGVWQGPVLLKASNAGTGDLFGYAVALSYDGSTLAVGARGEASAVPADPADESAPGAGAVYIFVRSGEGVWSEEAYLKASNVEADDNFGSAVALSHDGNRLAVGAPGEDGAVNDLTDSGAVYTFTRSNGGWTAQGYVKASTSAAGDNFGQAVSLSGVGTVLAVGAPFADNGLNANIGAAHVFVYGTGWSEVAVLHATNTGVNDGFGTSLALSSDAQNLVVGSPLEDSDAAGDNENELDAGAAYIFVNNGGWAAQAKIKAAVARAGDRFGASVAIGGSGGNIVAVGASREDGAAIGVGGDPLLGPGIDAGASYLFTREAMVWTQHAYLKATNTEFNDNFGTAMAMSSDGRTLAVGAIGEDGAATGIGGEQLDSATSDSGAVYLY